MSLLSSLFFDDLRPAASRKNWVIVHPFSHHDTSDDIERQWLRGAERINKDTTIVTDKDNFHASIDVQQFKPEEITVKLTDDNMVTIEGKHEEREDEHGYISRHFVRKYAVPEEYDVEKLQSKLSSDGVLSIVAPKKPQAKEPEYREIPIKLTGPIKSVGHHSGAKKPKTKRLNRKGPHSIK